MNTLQFIASIVDSLAWPIVVVIIARMATRAYSQSFEDKND